MKSKCFILFGLLMLSIIAITSTPSALAAPNMYIYPRVVGKEPGETFSVEVRVKEASNVFAWEFYLGWNSTILNVTRIAEGNFLKGFEQAPTFFVNKTYQDEVGTDYILVGDTRLGPLPGVGGSGVLANMTFSVQVKGETTLDLYDTKLRDSVPNPIEHSATDGLFTNVAGIPTASFTISSSKANVNETITFDASASSDPDGTIVNYFWEFGDGEAANETAPITYHSYTEGGIYSVTLIVTDDLGYEGVLIEEIKIRFTHDILIVSVSASPYAATVGDAITIQVTVGNEGTVTESGIVVTSYYDGTAVAPAQTVSSLVSGQNKTLTFNWNTADLVAGTYRIKAVAQSVTGEESIVDNTKLDGTVVLTAPPEFPWTYVIAGIAVIVVVLVVAAFFFLRRRRKSTKPT